MNKKLVFFDIDGTLLNNKKTINESTIKAIDDLKHKGFIFCIATGRGLSEGIIEIANIAKLNGFLILSNGNYIWDLENEKLLTIGYSISSDVVSGFFNAAQKIKRQFNICFSDGTCKNIYFGNDINSDIKDPKFYLIGPTIYKFDEVLSVEEMTKKEVMHVSIKAEADLIKKTYPELKKFEENQLAQVSNVLDIYIEAEAFGVSKWSGAQYLQNKLGISNENSYAFGDSKNDIILLSNIGNSICMGNGEPEVKNVAKHIIGDNNSDAIAEFLYKLVENEK